MNVEYIIVQAGGKGTRLEYLTKNKPKAIVPVENLPIVFHLFQKFPDKKFIIIADYKKDILREYLSCFADVKYQVVDAIGKGTCSGVRQAVELIPDDKPFMLIWSDLVLPNDFQLPKEEDNYIGISETFPCRWSYSGGKFTEERSVEFGVAGFFIFRDKSTLKNIPYDGEIVRWMSDNGLAFKTLGLAGTREYGLITEYEKLAPEKSRPFNRITDEGDILIKEGIGKRGKELAVREGGWYDYAVKKGIDIIPKIYSVNPIEMEKIKGKNIYEYNLSYAEKKVILKKLTDAIKSIHKIERVPADTFSLKKAYYTKTMDRLSSVRDLIPFADRKVITVNGRDCRNVFFYKRELEKRLEEIKCEYFCFIHGDCTFSNMMLRNDSAPVLIDPRGYFGYMQLYGDPLYDWAKLYYSIRGNYDRFNLKDFRLSINENDVTLKIGSNHWEDMERDFFDMSGADPEAVKLIHAVIWLSLTTYAWQDYDSICGAFYNGLYYLEEIL